MAVLWLHSVTSSSDQYDPVVEKEVLLCTLVFLIGEMGLYILNLCCSLRGIDVVDGDGSDVD